MDNPGRPTDVAALIARVRRPSRVVVTAGMPYANGPLHIGHLAGAHVPADIHARFQRMVVGRERVLFVCGTDDHGSTSELAAHKAGKPVAEFLAGIHAQQRRTLERYGISLDAWSGTSRPECFPRHAAVAKDLLARLERNGLLSKRRSRQWYDPVAGRFLADRLVRGRCPNPRCDNTEAYGDECNLCGHQHEPTELIAPRSSLTDAVPELRETAHWWLDMTKAAPVMRTWLAGKQKTWRPSILTDVREKLAPTLRFANAHEEAYKAIKASLPKHVSKYAAGKQVLVQCASDADLLAIQARLAAAGIPAEVADEWGHRAISRDTAWGLPLGSADPELAGKTLYVWPDSLIAPISFTQVALEGCGEDPQRWREFWCDPEVRITQFLGQDNVFFYVLMQGALWIGSQADITRLPVAGELQLTDVVANCHLLVNGEKMSKSRGNFFTGDELLDQRGYDADQIRAYLSILRLSEKSANFESAKLDERNAFLGGPLNAAFEKPLSAAHSKFGGVVPDGRLLEPVAAATFRIVGLWLKAMDRSDYPSLVFELENYARTINSLFTQYKPHDDRHDEVQRRDALFSSFFVLKNLMLMLHPFVPATMERLRRCLNLPETVWRIDELGTGLPAGHRVEPKTTFFPAVADGEAG